MDSLSATKRVDLVGAMGLLAFGRASAFIEPPPTTSTLFEVWGIKPDGNPIIDVDRHPLVKCFSRLLSKVAGWKDRTGIAGGQDEPPEKALRAMLRQAWHKSGRKPASELYSSLRNDIAAHKEAIDQQLAVWDYASLRIANAHVAGTIKLLGVPGCYADRRVFDDEANPLPIECFFRAGWEFTIDGWLILLPDLSFKGREPKRVKPDYADIQISKDDLLCLCGPAAVLSMPPSQSSPSIAPEWVPVADLPTWVQRYYGPIHQGAVRELSHAVRDSGEITHRIDILPRPYPPEFPPGLAAKPGPAGRPHRDGEVVVTDWTAANLDTATGTVAGWKESDRQQRLPVKVAWESVERFVTLRLSRWRKAAARPQSDPVTGPSHELQDRIRRQQEEQRVRDDDPANADEAEFWFEVPFRERELTATRVSINEAPANDTQALHIRGIKLWHIDEAIAALEIDQDEVRTAPPEELKARIERVRKRWKEVDRRIIAADPPQRKSEKAEPNRDDSAPIAAGPAVAKRPAKSNGRDYRDADAPLVEAMHVLIMAGQATSPEDAARHPTILPRVVGSGSASSRVARIAKHYRDAHRPAGADSVQSVV